MSEVLEFYQQQATAVRSNLPWLAERQAAALDDFCRYGFPARKDENWKYTVLDGFLKQTFTQPLAPSASQETLRCALGDTLGHRSETGISLSTSEFEHVVTLGHHSETGISQPTSELEHVAQSVAKGLPNQHHIISLHNGRVSIPDTVTLPAGVIVQPLLQALNDHPEKIKPHLANILQHQHGFDALNTAAWQSGMLIYLPAGVQVDTPIVLAHWQDQDQQAVHIRHLIIAEEGSQATIIESYHGEASVSYLTNVVTEVQLAARATLTHYKIQCESSAAYHIGHLTVSQGEASQFNSHSLSLGGKLVRSDLTFKLQAAHASCLLNGMYMPADQQHIDHHTIVHHLVPDCQSIQDYKGVMIGQSRAVFNGKVAVAKDAQHTRAEQQNKNILLSDKAEIDTKPQLEIFADDVICSHGATVGQLDEDALFYMTARGINRIDATRYLIHAFAADNLRLIAHAEVATWMANLINQQLR